MSDEEVKVEESINEPEVSVDLSSYTEEEQQAYAQGWRPDAGPKSAGEFLRTGQILEELKARGKETKALRSELAEMRKHLHRMSERELTAESENLKARKEAAISLGEHDTVAAIDQALDKIQKESTPTEIVMTPRALEFKEKHKEWLEGQDPDSNDLKVFAESLYVMHKNKQIQDVSKGVVTMSDDEIIDLIDAKVDKFIGKAGVKPTKTAPIGAAGITASREASSSSSKRGLRFEDLSPDEQEMGNYYEERGTMTKAEYLKEIAKIHSRESERTKWVQGR